MIIIINFIFLIINKFIYRFLLEEQIIEIIWTLIPGIILLFIALPSLRLLYLLDEIYNPIITIKIIGNQWYWSYEYINFNNIEFDSYIIQTNNISKKIYRLLETDNHLILPFKYNIRLLISSIDVIHSWTIPTIGIKVDAIPGRLNQSLIFINYPGLFFGQCSEICGINHRFIPIVLESIKINNFINWIKNY